MRFAVHIKEAEYNERLPAVSTRRRRKPGAGGNRPKIRAIELPLLHFMEERARERRLV
jgi:hypothetical protein